MLLAIILVLEVCVRLVSQDTDSGGVRFGKYALRPYALPLARAQAARERVLNGSPQYVIPDSVLGWKLSPNAKQARGMYSANAQGLRSDRDFAKAKNRGVLRIAVFGDSYVHGDEVLYNDTWIAQLERLLGEQRPVEIMNFGVGGYGNDQAYLYWKHIGRNYSPDIVLIGYQPENCKRNVNVVRAFYNQPVAFSKPRFVVQNGKLTQLREFPIDTLKLEDAMRAFPSEISKHEYFYNPEDYEHKLLYKSRLLSLALEIKDYFSWARRERAFYTPGTPEAELCYALLRAFAEEASRESKVYFVRMLNPEHLRYALGKGIALDEPLAARIKEHMRLIDTVPALEGSARNSSVGALYETWHYTPGTNRQVAGMVADALLQDLATA
jgi:hypothetical protein